VKSNLLCLAGQGSDLHRKHKVYLQLVGVATVPDSYDERLTEIAPGNFKHLHLFALDPYDLALSKLERNTQRDRDDMRHLARAVPFDIALLQERYQKELRPYLGNPEREDLTLRLWIEAIEEERAPDSPILPFTRRQGVAGAQSDIDPAILCGCRNNTLLSGSEIVGFGCLKAGRIKIIEGTASAHSRVLASIAVVEVHNHFSLPSEEIRRWPSSEARDHHPS
jgi:hypothetical protein